MSQPAVPPRPRPARRVRGRSRVLVLSAAGAVGAATSVLAAVAAAGPAAAAVPQGWPDTNPIEPMHVLGVLVGVPVLLGIVIALLVYVPPLVRGEKVTPGPPTVADQWLGGPRKSAGELAAPDTADSRAGGAGGTW